MTPSLSNGQLRPTAFGDRETGEAALVDPAYRPGELIDLVEGDDNARECGLCDALSPGPCPAAISVSSTNRRHSSNCWRGSDVPDVTVQADEVEWVTKTRRASAKTPSSLTAPATWLRWATFEVSLIHTPGHTPGSQCLW